MEHLLRLATTRDAEDLVALEYELFPENNFNEKTLKDEILHGTTWVATVGGLIVGYILCRRQDSILDILRLGVSAPFRRRRIATVLLEHAIGVCDHAMLTVRKGNDDAIELYKKHGFQITGTLPQHYSWVMELRKTSAAS